MDVQITLTTLGVFIIVFVLFLLAVLFYLYPGAAKSSTIPGPTPADAKDGNVSDLQHAGSLQNYIRELHGEYGDITAFWHGQNQIVSIADYKEFAPCSQVFEVPDILFSSWIPLIGKSSFIFEKDVKNFQRRDMLNFTVDASCKNSYAKLFLQFSTELVTKWKKTPSDQHVPLTQHISGLATRSVCRMVFGDYFKNDQNIIQLHKSWDLCWNHIEDVSTNQDNADEEIFNKNLEEIKSIISEALENRFKMSSKGDTSKVMIDGVLGKSKSSAITEDQLLSDAITLFTIGMQITTNVFLWVMYYLSSHSEVQTKLRKELLANKDMEIMPESLVNLKYLQNIIKESVRCGEVFSWRAYQQDMEANVKGHTIAKRSAIIEAVGESFKCERQWIDPCMFDPDRFFSKDVHLNPLEYIPFAFGGNRAHPEDSLVYLFISVATAVLIRNVQLRLEGDESSFERGYAGFISKPSQEELWVTVSPVEKKTKEVKTL